MSLTGGQTSCTHTLAASGDTILTLNNPHAPFAQWEGNHNPPSSTTPSPVTFRVSSQHLIQASSVFKAALTGCWKEASATAYGCYEISAEDWDAEAMLVVLSLIHSRTRSIPRTVTLELLSKIAVLVDYYELHEALHFCASLWMDNLRSSLPKNCNRDLMLWIFVSWVFKDADLFKAVTEIAITQSPARMAAIHLPIPEWVTSRGALLCTWTTWSAMNNALPVNRRTQDIPTTTAEAQRSIASMATAAMEAVREGALAEAAARQPTPAPGGGSDSYELPFTVKDVPQYTGDYMDYRRKLRDFVHIYQGIPVRQVPSAMFAIKTGLVEKHMSDLGSSKDAAVFSAGGRNLLEAWRAWQSWMDGLLISSTQFDQEIKSWDVMKAKAKRAQTSQEFYILFETCRLRFNEACTRTGVAEPTETEVTRHFIQALPDEIAIAARPHAPTLDRDQYRTHKDLLDTLWHLYRRIPARALIAKRGREEESEDEASAYPLPARKKTALARC